MSSRFYKTTPQDLVITTFSKAQIGSPCSLDTQASASEPRLEPPHQAQTQTITASNLGAPSPQSTFSQSMSLNALHNCSEQMPSVQERDLEDIEEWPTIDVVNDISTLHEPLPLPASPRGEKRPPTPIKAMEPFFRTKHKSINSMWWKDYFVGINTAFVKTGHAMSSCVFQIELQQRTFHLNF